MDSKNSIKSPMLKPQLQNIGKKGCHFLIWYPQAAVSQKSALKWTVKKFSQKSALKWTVKTALKTALKWTVKKFSQKSTLKWTVKTALKSAVKWTVKWKVTPLTKSIAQDAISQEGFHCSSGIFMVLLLKKTY